MTVEQIADFYLKKFLLWAGVLLVIATGGVIIYAVSLGPIFILAYLISATFTGTNLLVMRRVGVDDNQRFFKIFGWSLFLRFAGVLVAIIMVLRLINIHEIFFTVSFIISYICHSVIEIIFINKILKTDTNH